MSAMRMADDLRAESLAAAALFKPSQGGWIVQVFPGGIRSRPVPARPDQDRALSDRQALW